MRASRSSAFYGAMAATGMVTEMVGGEHVVRAPGVCGGRPTFKYTRIEIAGVLARLARGETVEGIVRGYEGRSPPKPSRKP